jgi:hypothetical protein
MKLVTSLALLLGIAVPGIAHAEAGDPYQFVFISGSAAAGQNVLRVNTATGQSILCAGSLTCIPITEAKPVSAGNYGLSSWLTTDGANRSWGATRFDKKSGRSWALNFDGKTANWAEYIEP